MSMDSERDALRLIETDLIVAPIVEARRPNRPLAANRRLFAVE